MTPLRLQNRAGKDGLLQLALTIVRLLHVFLVHPAIRRLQTGGVTREQVEDLGPTLMRQAEALEKLRVQFGHRKAWELGMDWWVNQPVFPLSRDKELPAETIKSLAAPISEFELAPSSAAPRYDHAR